jgi:hypothetical protein
MPGPRQIRDVADFWTSGLGTRGLTSLGRRAKRQSRSVVAQDGSLLVSCVTLAFTTHAGSSRRTHELPGLGGRERHYNLRCDRGKAEAIGTVVLAHLTVPKLSGEAISYRPLLTLGMLLVLVGVELVALDLVSELVASHHEERTGGRTAEFHVDEILR